MNDDAKPVATGPGESDSRPPQTIIIQQPIRSGRLLTRLLMIGLTVSILVIFGMWARYQEYYSNVTPTLEKFHSGERSAQEKIALIRVSGTIMPPFTTRILNSIQRAGEDEAVKGVVLVVDSPGGLVTDSHQIYHALKKLSTQKQKPIFVAMKRMAASGGYYISMGAGESGKIYAEPTTWTGSIGVIIPHYDVSKLAEEWKISADPLKTGQFKDALSPFRELSGEERQVWNEILDDAFQRFLEVIADNRQQLDRAAVKKLATGQIYTALQAVENGLVDEIGYMDDAIDALKAQLELEEVRVVTYQYQPSLAELLVGSAEAKQPEPQWRAMLDATVPRAMYFFSWTPGVPGW